MKCVDVNFSFQADAIKLHFNGNDLNLDPNPMAMNLNEGDHSEISA